VPHAIAGTRVSKARIASGPSKWLRTVKLTSHGRDLLEGIAQQAAPPFTLSNTFITRRLPMRVWRTQMFSQHVTINPDVVEILAALCALRETAGQSDKGAGASALAHDAHEELQKHGWSKRRHPSWRARCVRPERRSAETCVSGLTANRRRSWRRVASVAVALCSSKCEINTPGLSALTTPRISMS